MINVLAVFGIIFLIIIIFFIALAVYNKIIENGDDELL